MSLPFLNGFMRSQNQSICKRVRVKGQGKGSKAVARTSHDGDRPTSLKRSAAEQFTEFWGHNAPHLPHVEGCVEEHEQGVGVEDVRVKVAVVGLGQLGSSVALCLASKPGLVRLAVYHHAHTATDVTDVFEAMPGVIVKHAAADVCAWADILIVCCDSYEASADALGSSHAVASLKGKTILQLTPGAPHQATDAAALASRWGAQYLDGLLLGCSTELATAGSCITVAGPRSGYRTVEALVLAMAPDSFWCGEDPRKANALNLCLFTFITGAYAAYVQALTFGQHFGLAPHVVPTLITGGMIPLLQRNITADAEAREEARQAEKRALVAQAHMRLGGPGSHGNAAAAVSPALKADIQKVMDVCAREGLDVPYFDGLMAMFGAERRLAQPFGESEGNTTHESHASAGQQQQQGHSTNEPSAANTYASCDCVDSIPDLGMDVDFDLDELTRSDGYFTDDIQGLMEKGGVMHMSENGSEESDFLKFCAEHISAAPALV